MIGNNIVWSIETIVIIRFYALLAIHMAFWVIVHDIKGYRVEAL